ncbi:cyanase [Streptomyces sp. VRA16 Mangrove soil]|uniref:cyanase n=1 Tax=Streptomyces sp. VRA16 Mangrove soil TaxID=2817434 RepID=UPI001A9D59C9|nr:cyanase [Streptomyces sp. VRA16 Mangrove soil]MBO1330076.1 cyanase [Streptomyces sp. VRA16 Mangrove soil]
MIDRSEATHRILAAKESAGLSFEEIAAAVGAHEVWVASALLGQNTMTRDQAAAAGKLLGLDEETVAALTRDASRGSLGQAVPTDPLIYRLYEIVQVYGTTMKAVIEEKFGSGIMSAIDFSMDIQKKPDPKGDRVVVTLDGKFLPYRTW